MMHDIYTELVTGFEVDGGRPGGEVGLLVPRAPGLADGVAGAGRRRGHHCDGEQRRLHTLADCADFSLDLSNIRRP
jgi:hypothetical protein